MPNRPTTIDDLKAAERNPVTKPAAEADAAVRKADLQRTEKALASVMQKTLADLLQTSGKVIREWEAAGMPGRRDEGRRARYDLWVVLPWLKNRWLVESREAKSDSPALERLRLARAEQEELKLQELKGRLIDKADVEAGLVARAISLKRGFLAIPRASAPVLAGMSEPREIEAHLAERMRELLSLYAGDERGKGS